MAELEKTNVDTLLKWWDKISVDDVTLVSGGVKLDENRRFEIPGGFLVLKQRTGSFDCRFGAMVDVNR